MEDIFLELNQEFTNCDNCNKRVDVDDCVVLDSVYLCKDCGSDINVLISEINQHFAIDGDIVVEILELIKSKYKI